MSNALIRWLKQPFPSGYAPVFSFTPILVGCFIYSFLSFFEPFQIHMLGSTAIKQWILGGYGLVTMLSMYLYEYGLLGQLRSYREELNWTVGKHILSVLGLLFLIGIGNFFYSYWILQTEFRWSAFIFFQLATVALGIFPVTAITLIRYNFLIKRNLEDAASLSKELPKQVNDTKHDLKIEDKQGKTLLNLKLSCFIAAAADDNYLDIYYLKMGILEHDVVRFTLARLEAVVKDRPNLVRCHRKYLVNLDFVEQCKGNAQGLRLKLANIDSEIPVARALVEEVRKRLQSPEKFKGIIQ